MKRVAQHLDVDLLRSYRIGGVKPEAIAAINGCSVSTVKKRLKKFGLVESMPQRAPRTPRIQLGRARQEVAQPAPVAAAHAAHNPFGL